MREPVPTSVGLCPNPDHTGEFYMPDATDGDKCPQRGCDQPLVIYRRGTIGEAMAATIGEGTERVDADSVRVPVQKGSGVQFVPVNVKPGFDGVGGLPPGG